MTVNEYKNITLDFLEWSRNIHDYDRCSAPDIDEKLKNIKLKTDETGYQFHNLDVSNLYEHTLRSLNGQSLTRKSKKRLQLLDGIINVATELLYEMSDTDVPNWWNDKSLLGSLIDVKEHIKECA